MDRRSSVDKLDKVLGEGKANGCNVVDMKQARKVISVRDN